MNPGLFRAASLRTRRAAFTAPGSPAIERQVPLRLSAFRLPHGSFTVHRLCPFALWSGFPGLQIERVVTPLTTAGTPLPWDSRPLGNPMFATAVRAEHDLGVLSVSLNAPTGHRSLPRRIAASAQSHRAAGAGAGYRCLSGGCSITPSGDWDSGNPTFTLSRGSPGAPPLAAGRGHRFSAMLFSLIILSDSGKASDPEISPLISARCAGNAT
jgi:hypothetical protein